MRSNRTRRRTRRSVLTSLGGVAALGTVGGLVSGNSQDENESAESNETNESDAETGTDPETDDAGQAEGPFASVYQETIDSVVLVQVAGTDGRQGGIGSGFVYDDQHLVTNHHVVGEASEVSIQFSDERWRTGEVVGSDAYSDLAAIRVEDVPDDASPLAISEEEPVIGREVVALGNPLGLDASISQGIISGVNRALPSPSGFAIPAAIQTDAPVNPGNSGGPLVNLDAEVVGVISAGAGQSIGFAIPAALVRRVIPALIEEGEYDHPYLGIGVLPVSPPVAEANDLEQARGVLVTEVVPNSPAEGALQPADLFAVVEGSLVPVGGDVIVEIDGTEIPNQELLSSYLALEASPGEPIEIGVIREGERQLVELTPGERPEPPAGAGPGGEPGSPGSEPEEPGPEEPEPEDPPEQPNVW